MKKRHRIRTYFNSLLRQTMIVPVYDYQSSTNLLLSEVGIVIQGPVGKKEIGMFSRSISNYQKCFKADDVVVVSTDLCLEARILAFRANIVVVDIEYTNPGINNVRIQSRSVLKGLSYLSHPFVVKVRADQYVSKSDFFLRSKELLSKFELVAVGYHLKNIKGHVGDMLVMGKCELLESIYKDLDTESFYQKELSSKLDSQYMNSPEVFLGTIIGKRKVLKLGFEDVGLIWNKYHPFYESRAKNFQEYREVFTALDFV